MIRSKLPLLILACAAVVGGALAVAETAPDFDGKSESGSNIQLPDARGIGAASAAQKSNQVVFRDVDWRNDAGAFKNVKVDKKIYTGVKALGEPIRIDPGAFKEKLEELTGVRDVVIGGKTLRMPDRGSKEGRDLARQWLAQEYQKLGFQVSVQEFNSFFRKGANFIAEKPGTSGKVLIISAHLDSVDNAGADDDGSGTIAALLVAKALKGIDNKHTLRVLGFDMEEAGLVGSEAYAPTLDKSKIIGDIQMDMVSFNSRKDGHFHLMDCGRNDSKFLTENLMGTVQSMGLPLTREEACTDRSDHAAFWERGIPAVVMSENFFGGDSDTCYHQPCDVVDGRLDFQYASTIATAIANSLPQLLGAVPAH